MRTVVVVRKSQPIFVGRHKRSHEPHTVTTGGRLHVHKLAEDLDTMKLGGGSVAHRPSVAHPTEHLAGNGKTTDRFQKIMSIDDMRAKPIGKIY